MPDGLEQLRSEGTAFERTLDSFEGPLVEDHAGLRLMAESLRERRDHIAAQIDKAETAVLEVALDGGAVPAAVAAGVLAGLQEAVLAVGAEVAPDLDPAALAAALALRLDPDGEVLRLLRPAGPRAGLRPAPDGDGPLVERALAGVVERLAGDDVAPALRELGAALHGSGLVATVTLSAPDGGATARIDQARAQRLAG